MKLATSLLALDAPEMTPKRVQKLLRSRNETYVTLKQPVAIQIRYSTVDVDQQGRVRFYPDVYSTLDEEDGVASEDDIAEGR